MAREVFKELVFWWFSRGISQDGLVFRGGGWALLSKSHLNYRRTLAGNDNGGSSGIDKTDHHCASPSCPAVFMEV